MAHIFWGLVEPGVSRHVHSGVLVLSSGVTVHEHVSVCVCVCVCAVAAINLLCGQLEPDPFFLRVSP